MTTFVLIPGAGGQAWYWHRLVPELEAAGHGALAVELPADDESAGLAAYTDNAVAAIGERTDLVVVGQSMGALTAPLVCERVPVDLLVLLNGMVATPGESGGEWWSNTGQGEAAAELARSQGRDPEAEFDEAVIFLHDIPDEVMASAPGPRNESDRAFADPWPLESWPDVPTRVIVGADDRLFPADFQTRVAEERLGITPDLIPGGHLAALSHPKELAALLLSYVAK